MDAIVWDVEANELTRNVSEIHCIVIQDLETQEVKRYHDYWSLPQEGTLQEGIDRVVNADIIIGHNIAGYDKDVLARIGKAQWREDQIVIDTMLMSCILYPNMQMNGLDAWAKKLKLDEQKIQNTDWRVLTSNILNRCVSDVKINREVYLYFLKKIQTLQRAHSDILNFGTALKLEAEVARIHTKQVLHGIFYDVALAESLVVAWRKEMSDLTKKIHALAPRRLVQPYSVEVKRVFLKQSKKEEREGAPLRYTKAVQDWFMHDDRFKCPIQQKVSQVAGPFSRIRFDKINLDSGPQVKEFLLGIGWRPTEWNWGEDEYGNRIKTSPKLTEDSYASLPDGLGRDVANYNVLKHRLSLLVNKKDPENKGSLPLARKCYDPETGLGNVGADAFTCGTNTARYRHTKPVANLPGVEADYGLPTRQIYRGPKGLWQVGVDLSGIEARMLCHLCFNYGGGPEFAAMVLEGDWHSHNASLWNVQRRVAKIILYAMMYGAGDGKLGSEAGGGVQRGKEIRAAFFEGNPAYADLVKDLEDAYQTNGGWLPSMDGRPLYPRTKKDILNTTIQGNSAVVFKKWMIRCDKLEDVQLGHAHQMVAYHDELQFAYYNCDYDYHPEKFGNKLCEESLATGVDMDLLVPIAAEFKVGKNYADCH